MGGGEEAYSLRTIGIVFDLWYTLSCPEDHGRPGGGEANAISAALCLDPAAFADYWTARLDEMQRSPRSPEDYVIDYVSWSRTHAERR